MKTLWGLFLTFARIGAFTFGGGYAMLPMLQREVVENRKWATEDEVLDYFAIAGSVFPSLVIIVAIAAVLTNFAELAVVQYAFGGIRVVVGVLILNAILGMWKKSIVDKFCVCLAVVSFLLSAVVDVSPVVLVICAGVLGIAVQTWKAGRTKGGADQ